VTAACLLIVNPRSAHGSTGRRWGEIRATLARALQDFDTVFTERPGHATLLAREASSVYGVVAAVGGDGTINEVLNGLMAGGQGASGAALGVIPRGTGSDFVRSVGIPHDLLGAARVLAAGERRLLDVGRAQVMGLDGKPLLRFFINEAEVGMGAAVSDAVNRSSKRFGALSFWWGILATMLRYRDRQVTLRLDGGPAEEFVINNIWVANGRFSGGGMKSAPRAQPDDGLLDVVLVARAGLLPRLRTLLGLRSGRFTVLPHVRYRRARTVEVLSGPPAPVEVEGELVGKTPAVFDLLPRAISVIAPPAAP